MKKAESAFKITCMGFTVLWLTMLIISVIAQILYAVPDEEPLDFTLSKGVYNVFLLISFLGFISSFMLLLSLSAFYKRRNSDQKKQRTLKNITLAATIMDNLLFYLSIGLIFLVNSDAIIFAPFIWCLCSIICAVLLIVLKIKIRQKTDCSKKY